MIEVTRARNERLGEVRALYARCGYTGGVSEQDVTLIARVDGKLAGVVRICPEPGCLVLRGMQVAADHQRQGVGTQLLTACRPYLDRQLAFCLPYTHLTGFYGKERFTVISPSELPGFLADRLAAYLGEGQQVLAMQRLPLWARSGT